MPLPSTKPLLQNKNNKNISQTTTKRSRKNHKKSSSVPLPSSSTSEASINDPNYKTFIISTSSITTMLHSNSIPLVCLC